MHKNTWLGLMALVGFAYGLSAFAVETRRRTTTSTAHPDSSVERVSIHEGALPMVVNVAPAIMVTSGPALPGVNLELTARIIRSVNLYGGVVSGGYFFTAETFGAVIPLLPTAYFEFSPSPKVHPILGVALGPVIGAGNSTTAVRFGMLFRTGMNIYLAPDIALNVEPRLGVIGSSFTFIPQLGATFAL